MFATLCLGKLVGVRPNVAFPLRGRHERVLERVLEIGIDLGVPPVVVVAAVVANNAAFLAEVAANAAMRLCPGSSVPSSANDAHGSSFPAFRDCVTHAGCTTGGWFRSAFFNAASLAAVNPAHTTCVTATRE